MTQEDKELLLRDISARLPYHVKVKVWYDETTEEGALDLEHNYADVLRDTFYYNKIKDIKPYLRPMSSMTEEEINEFHKLRFIHINYGLEPLQCVLSVNEIDWLNAHHFDFRNLIERGLAIDCTDLNVY